MAAPTPKELIELKSLESTLEFPAEQLESAEFRHLEGIKVLPKEAYKKIIDLPKENIDSIPFRLKGKDHQITEATKLAIENYEDSRDDVRVYRLSSNKNIIKSKPFRLNDEASSISKAIKSAIKKHEDFCDGIKIFKVKEKYTDGIPVFKMILKGSKEDRMNKIEAIEDALEVEGCGYIIDKGFDLFKSGLANEGKTKFYGKGWTKQLVETGETTFFFKDGKIQFTQKPLISDFKVEKPEPVKELIQTYETIKIEEADFIQENIENSLTEEIGFYADERAYVPIFFYSKEEKTKGLKHEGEIDASPPNPNKAFIKATLEISKEAEDELTQKRIEQAKRPSLTTTFVADEEVRARIMNGSGSKPTKGRIDTEKAEAPKETPVPTKKFGIDYVMLAHQGKKLPIIDFQPLSAEHDPNADVTAANLQAMRDFAEASMNEDVTAISCKNKKIEIVSGDYLSAAIVYHGDKPFRLWGIEGPTKALLKDLEEVYHSAIEDYNGNVNSLKDVIKKAKEHFDGLEEKIKDKKKKVVALATGLTTGLVITAAIGGAALSKSNEHHTPITPDTNHNPVLDYIADQEVKEGDQLYLEVFAHDQDLSKGDVLTFLDNSTYFDLVKMGTDKASITWKPTKDQIGKHPISITVKDKFGKSDTKSFNITVKEKPIVDGTNLAPELIDGYLKQLSNTEYQLIVRAKDKIGDDYPGYTIEALLDGNVIGSSTDKDLVKSLYITDPMFALGDNEIDILIKDKLDPAKNVTKTLSLHKNLPPVVGLEVEKLIGDNYKLKIDADSFDDNLDKIQIYVGGQLHKEINGTSSHMTLEEQLDLTKFIGDKEVKVKVTDKFGDFDEVSKTVACENDAMTHDITFSESNHEDWNYVVNFDGIDNKIAKVEVKSPELSIDKIFTPNVQKGNVNGNLNLTNALPGNYNVIFELTDDLGQKVSEQRTVVLDNDGIKCIYNVSNKNDNIKVVMDLSDTDTKITELDVDFGGEHNITSQNSKTIHYEHTFDATQKAPGNTYVSAKAKDELNKNQDLFNVTVSIADDFSFVEKADAGYNPIDEIVKIYNGTAKDNDTNLENVLYKVRDSGNNVVKQGSLNPSDGSFDSKAEGFNGTIGTSGLADGKYILEITPKSNGIEGKTFFKQIEINHTYEIVPVWNADKDSANGQLSWNETSGKADLLLEGNNTYFKNWQDEWNAVDPALKQAVIQNWTTVVNTADPFATAVSVQGKVRDIHGTSFTDSDVYNSTREQFVACLDYIKNDTLNNASISAADKAKWDRFYVTNIAAHFETSPPWHNALYSIISFDVDNDGAYASGEQKFFSYGASPGDYSFLKSNYDAITEYNSYKTATSQAQAEKEAKNALNIWARADVNWADVDVDETTLVKLLGWIDVPTSANYDKLQKTLQVIDTYQKMSPSYKIKVRYDSGSDDSKFWNA